MRIACVQCTLETEAVVHMVCQSVCVLVLFKVIYFSFTYVCLCVSMPMQARNVRIPEAGVLGSC